MCFCIVLLLQFQKALKWMVFWIVTVSKFRDPLHTWKISLWHGREGLYQQSPTGKAHDGTVSQSLRRKQVESGLSSMPVRICVRNWRNHTVFLAAGFSSSIVGPASKKSTRCFVLTAPEITGLFSNQIRTVQFDRWDGISCSCSMTLNPYTVIIFKFWV